MTKREYRTGIELTDEASEELWVVLFSFPLDVEEHLSKMQNVVDVWSDIGRCYF